MGRFTSGRIAFALLLGCWVFLHPGDARAADAGLPIPPAAQIERAQKFVRGIFKIDYSKKSKPERQEFAQKLLSGADDAKDDPAMRYVMRLEARDVAAMAPDLTLMHRAVDAATEEFAVDPHQLTIDGLTAGTRGGNRTTAESEEIASLWIDLLEQTAAERKFALAAKAATGAEAGVKFVKDKKRVERIRSQVKFAREGLQVQQSAATARLALTAHPDDPAANLAMGKVVCFAENKWAEGLPYLAKGTKDPALKKIIDQDLAKPKAATAQVTVADAWLDYGNAQPDGLAKESYRARAAQWYSQALPQATGLTKTKITLRLADLNGTGADSNKPDAPARGDRKPRRIVFICDGRGSMIDVLGSVRQLISKTINDLDDTQSFTLLFAQQNGLGTLSSKLLPANAENKKKVPRWLDEHPCGGVSVPLPALTAAFELNPDAIWFFTVSDFPDNAAFARELEKMNRGDRVSFNLTVLSPSRSAEDFPGLQQITKENRGELRVINGRK